MIAFSERASGESAWLLIGLPGAAMALGFIELWSAIGCTTGIVLSWIFIARKLRRECDRHGDLTLPEFFMNRFPEATGLLRLSASLLIAFFFAFYVAAQINAAGKVLDATFPDMLAGIRDTIGLETQTQVIGMIIGAVIIIFYTMMGGFLAVAWTDLFQGIIMIFTLVVLPLAAFIAFMNGPEAAGRLEEISPTLLDVTGGKTGFALGLAVLGGLSWGLGYMGQPHLLARYQAIRSARDIRQGSLIAICWAVPAFWGAFLIGIVGLLVYGEGSFADPEQLMPTLAKEIMPAWLAGIMISGAVAAMMSTADSQLLITSSTLSEDIVHKFLGFNLSQRVLVLVSRGFTFAIGVLGFYLAVNADEDVYHIVDYAWFGLAAAFGPPLILTLYWKGTNGFGVLAGMIIGAAVVILWDFEWFKTLYAELFLDVGPGETLEEAVKPLRSLHRYLGFGLSFVLVILVSLVTGGKKTPLPPLESKDPGMGKVFE